MLPSSNGVYKKYNCWCTRPSIGVRVHTNDRVIFLVGITMPRQVYIETVPSIFVHSWRISINISYIDSFKSFISIDEPISFRFAPYFRLGTVKDVIDCFATMTITCILSCYTKPTHWTTIFRLFLIFWLTKEVCPCPLLLIYGSHSLTNLITWV